MLKDIQKQLNGLGNEASVMYTIIMYCINEICTTGGDDVMVVVAV